MAGKRAVAFTAEARPSACRPPKAFCCSACRAAARACAPRPSQPLATSAAALRHGPHVRQPRRLLRGERPPRHRGRRVHRPGRPLGGRDRQGFCRLPRLRRHGRRHHRPRLRNLPDLAVGEERAGIRRRHRQRHLTVSARTASGKGAWYVVFFMWTCRRRKSGRKFSRIHSDKRHRDPADFDMPALVAASPEFSGAEIEEAIISALYDAFYTKEELSTAHVLEALGQTVPLARRCPRRSARNAIGPRAAPAMRAPLG